MSFIKLDRSLLTRLLSVLEKGLPKTAMIMNIVTLSISGKYPPEHQTDIYSYNGVVDEEILFVIAILKHKLQTDPFIIIHSPEAVTQEMLDAFTKLFDWSNVLGFESVPCSFAHHLEDIVRSKKGRISKNPASDMYFPREEALKLDLCKAALNQNFDVKKLSPEHALKVKANWKYGDEYDVRSISDCIASFGSAGIFKKNLYANCDQNESQSDDDLVSWVVISNHGTLNALHTLEENRGQGLAKWAIEAGSKFMAVDGLVPLCVIEHYNDVSMNLVKKVGFSCIRDIYWMWYNPSVPKV